MFSMHVTVVAGHGLLSLFVGADREPLHFRHIAAALLRRHRLADFDKMLEHLRLALRAEDGKFRQFCFATGVIFVLPASSACNSCFLAAISPPHIRALGHVTGVQLAHERHVGVVEMKFLAQPIEIIG